MNGITAVAEYGLVSVWEYDQDKQKYKVIYLNDAAVGWLKESQFSVTSGTSV